MSDCILDDRPSPDYVRQKIIGQINKKFPEAILSYDIEVFYPTRSMDTSSYIVLTYYVENHVNYKLFVAEEHPQAIAPVIIYFLNKKIG